MSDVVYPYNRQFRLKVLRLCFDDSWMGRYGRTIVKPEYFELDDEYDIADALLTYRETYGRCPKDFQDIVLLCDGQYDELLEGIYHITIDNVQFVTDQIVQFAKEQAAKIAILESVEDINKGDLKSPIVRMREALKIGEDISKPGIDFIGDVDDWLFNMWTDKVRTGWFHIDRHLEGGLGPGELGVIMAPTNRGKSMALVNIGCAAAGIGSKKNVVHFTHEMGYRLVAKRYAARMMFRFPKRDEDLYAYADELQIAARKLIPGKIRIIGGPEKMSLVQIEQYIERLNAEDFNVGLLIDDYADLIVPDRHYTERRFELSSNYQRLREFVGSLGIPGWTATQSNRASFSKEVVTLQDISEDLGKAMIADIVVAVCQTKEEKDSDQCRLFLAKVRDGEDGAMFHAKYYGKQQAIITTGYVTSEDGVDA